MAVSNGKKRKKRNQDVVVKLELTQSEVDVLKKACSKYRQTVPIYIESKRQEVTVIDSVLSKLDE